MNEKITDKARGMFEKATGYVVMDLIRFPSYTTDFALLLPNPDGPLWGW